MTWTKLPPLSNEKIHIGCLNCSTACLEAPLDLHLAVGFGSSYATRDGEHVADGEDTDLTVGDIEKMAAADPDHDWKIIRIGPLHGETFQRHDVGKWVCVESNQGFA